MASKLKGSEGRTGDLRNNIVKLLREIDRMKLQVKVDINEWCKGTPSSLLPLMHSALVQYSIPVAEWLLIQGYSLYGRSDLKFVEGVYRVLRHGFNYRPTLSQQQFFAKGYVERKIMLICDLLLLCQAKHKQLTGKEKSKKCVCRVDMPIPHEKKVNVLEKSPAPDVLTVQDREGIGSVWRDPLPPPTCAFDEPQRLEHSHAPQSAGTTLKQHLPCHVPLHIPTSNCPVSPSPSPELVVKHTSTPEPLSRPAPSSLSPPPAPASAQHRRQHSDYVDMTLGKGNKERGRKEHKLIQTGSEEELASWKPLPEVRKEEGEVPEGLMKDLDSRVGRLTNLVEQMSARFTVVETQLMLAKSGDRGTQQTVAQNPLHSPTRVDNNTLHPPTPHTTRTPATGGRKEATPTRTTPHSSKKTVQLIDTSTRSTPFLDNNGCRRDLGHPLCCPLSHAASPNTEETQRLIDQLRTRALKTRLFLQQATTSSYTGRDL